MAFADDLRDAIRTERMRRRMTQSDAAALVGRTGKWLSEYELGKKEPGISSVMKLAEALGLELSVKPPEGWMLPDLDRKEAGPAHVMRCVKTL